MVGVPGYDWRQLRVRWQRVDALIRTWWDADLRRANEEQVRDPQCNQVWFVDDEHRAREQKGAAADAFTLLYLPFPYMSAGGSEAAFPEMYCWDVPFINRALLLHGHADIVRHHLLNHLFLIDRYGFVLTGNRTYYLTRSQTPLLADAVVRYARQTGENEILLRAYPLLTKEYEGYWTAPPHLTPTGLSTNVDSGDSRLRPELAAEAESLDFTPIYDGDIRQCVPLQLNCALVRYEESLAWIAGEIGREAEQRVWVRRAETRKRLIRQYCWDEAIGFFFEYHMTQRRQLPYWSLAGFWTMWAGVATPDDAAKMVMHLKRFAFPFGLTETDIAYPSPHPEFSWLQWGYPSAWPPSQMIVVEALDRYGYHAEAEDVAGAYVRNMLDEFDRTGSFWEKYNGVEGSSRLPRERTPSVPMHGWSTAAAVWLGHRLFGAGGLPVVTGEMP
jgi:alpha,alpha-trehalase